MDRDGPRNGERPHYAPRGPGSRGGTGKSRLASGKLSAKPTASHTAKAATSARMRRFLDAARIEDPMRHCAQITTENRTKSARLRRESNIKLYSINHACDNTATAAIAAVSARKICGPSDTGVQLAATS